MQTPIPGRSALMSLPAELRTHIFEYAFQGARCRRPLIIQDAVYTQIDLTSTTKTTSLLLACRSTYKDCLPILYGSATVEVSLRSDTTDDFQTFLANLGPIEDCRLLKWLRHIELEISFNAEDEESMSRVAHRMARLSSRLDEIGKLKTLELVFFHQGHNYQGESTPADAMLELASTLRCEKLLGVSRNIASKQTMDPRKWMALRRSAFNYYEGEEECFHEISFDYWERAFRSNS